MDGLLFLEDSSSQGRPFSVLTLQCESNPLSLATTSNSSSGYIVQSLYLRLGRREVGGEGLPQRLQVFPLAPWAPLMPGFPAILPREAG